ncbi:hypothetical protein [uncultured Desulfosarcina sp.]|uniref:hypothetical protein n=1 Tax=uncultured Desulfosarcina sp. TaxID=218289 RepID=UPI0029C6D77D|nr:hypothetical protein [uncultured Desulfosarcina sp.]
MQKNMGIWIDHKKAVIVTLNETGDTKSIREIQSDLERHVRLSGGSRTKRTPWGPQQIASDSKMEARHRQQLSRFYQKIVEAVADAYKIFLMGPGEAKVELKKEMDKSKAISESLVFMGPCDKMTQRQVAARVRDFFAPVP